MTSLAEKIMQAKNAKINSNPLNVPKVNQGIITKEIDSTLEKFARIESMEKLLNNHGLILEKIFSQIGLVSSDQKSIVNCLESMSKSFSENNEIIISIASNSKSIKSQIDSIANRMVFKSEAKAETVKTEAKAETVLRKKAETKTEAKAETNNENEKLWNIFQSYFNGNFMGSKTYSEISGIWESFIEKIDFSDIDKSIRKIWKSTQKETGKYFFAMVSLEKACKAMEKAIADFSGNDETIPEAKTEVKQIPVKKQLPTLGNKAKAENDQKETLERNISYFKTNLANENENDLLEIIKVLKTENVTEANKSETVNLVFDWLKNEFDGIKKSTVSDFVKFYIENKLNIIRHYAIKMN